MKKTIILISCVMLIILALVIGKYLNYRAKYNEIKEQNLQYEYYYQKDIYGTEIATVVNKAVNQN